jgi:hypothetical protein
VAFFFCLVVGFFVVLSQYFSENVNIFVAAVREKSFSKKLRILIIAKNHHFWRRKKEGKWTRHGQTHSRKEQTAIFDKISNLEMKN